jgi:DtxR family transcriptional regulator, Mn-dependent transcriptional regulator
VTPASDAPPSRLTEALEDCLRQVFKLEDDHGHATNSALAERLRLAPSSTTALVKRLSILGLVEHTPYQGARLSPEGRRLALALVRRHRLLERFLSDTLGVDLAEVHAEADRLEHGLSEALQERIALVLGNPELDPHGDPIPGPDLEIGPSTGSRPLAALAPGEPAHVRRIPDDDDAMVAYLETLGIVPGTQIEVVEAAPFDGPLTLRVDGEKRVVSLDLARVVSVG